MKLEKLPQDNNSSKETEVSSLEELRELYQDCMSCTLGSGRNQLVFGHGIPKSPLMFIGEGPGADEDEQGNRGQNIIPGNILNFGYKLKNCFVTKP